MLLASGTGIATYARALRSAQCEISDEAFLLSGGANGYLDARQAASMRALRSLKALFPHERRVRAIDKVFLANDVFRLGQAYFNRHGRAMPIRPDGPPGIMHWTYPVPLYLCGWRNLYTVHDAIPLTDPELTPIASDRHRRLLEAVASVSDTIVTVSESAARDVAGVLGGVGGQIVDCSQPVVLSSEEPLDLPSALSSGRYLLVCGSVEPRKNIARIIEAHAKSGTALPLVLAGPDGWRADTIDLASAGDRVIRLPYQPRGGMIALIANARALLMPSLAEGFGLPVAEAMMLGTPVITSRYGALAETAGTAALLVDPRDSCALAFAIARISTDDAFCATLRERGLAQRERFSMERFVTRLATLYDAL